MKDVLKAVETRFLLWVDGAEQGPFTIEKIRERVGVDLSFNAYCRSEAESEWITVREQLQKYPVIVPVPARIPDYAQPNYNHGWTLNGVGIFFVVLGIVALFFGGIFLVTSENQTPPKEFWEGAIGSIWFGVALLILDRLNRILRALEKKDK